MPRWAVALIALYISLEARANQERDKEIKELKKELQNLKDKTRNL